MEQKNIEKYFFFGTCVRYLQDATAGFRIHDTAEGGWYTLSNLSQFFKHVEELNLQVTSRMIWPLIKLKKELEKTENDAVLTKEQANRLSKLMNDIRPTLDAELKGFDAYVVTPKRLDVYKLTQDVRGLFAPGVYDSLSEITKFDLAEAAKCIAFERPTAAAFHLLRGLESLLRVFYLKLVKKKRSALMWGPIIADLRKRHKAKPFAILLNHLDNIRISFRNPTQHPEKVYDIQEVQDLWGVCVDVVNRIAKEL